MKFAELAGTWRGEVRTWLDPTADPAVNEMSGTFRLAFGDKTVIHDYESAVGDKTANGSMIIGPNLETGRFNLVWIDSFHTGGGVQQFDAEGEASFRGSYAAGTEMWHWRIAFTMNGKALRIAHTNISPDGGEDRAIEVEYARV